MRRVVVPVVVLAAAGCFAPFSWPDEREQPPAPAAEPDDALARAADCLDRGDEAAAVPHLRAHVRAHPDAVMVRAHLAELLFRGGDPDGARAHFERFVADAQPLRGPAHDHLPHCHTRLMELAEARGDDYAERLHRGAGLVRLVRKWDADPDRRDDAAAEQALAQATAALRAAADVRPGDARAHLYLAEAYARLGQPSAARAAVRTASAGLPDPALTAAERARLADLAAD